LDDVGIRAGFEGKGWGLSSGDAARENPDQHRNDSKEQSIFEDTTWFYIQWLLLFKFHVGQSEKAAPLFLAVFCVLIESANYRVAEHNVTTEIET
jgi:hypothetical protein